MAKVIIGHVFHNCERTKERMLGIFLQLIWQDLYFSYIIKILAYTGGAGETRTNATVAQALAGAREQL